MPQPLSQQQLSNVLRRAAELERKRRDEATGGEGGLSEQELAELVKEVGLPQEDVNRALAELRTGVLQADDKTAPTLADRLVGREEVLCERVVRGDLATIERRVAEFLRSQLLEVRRDFGDRVVWGTSPGLLARARRALDFQGRISLPPRAQVESLVASVPGESGKVIVRLVLRAGELRRRKLQELGTMAVAGAGIAAAGIAVASGTTEILAIGGGVVAASAGWWSARAGYQRTLVGASEALERFLDGLQHRERRGSTPPPPGL
jgi:hypothetical protein